MGDDMANGGVYKFVSDRRSGRAGARRTCGSWRRASSTSPAGTRRAGARSTPPATRPTSPTERHGHWGRCSESELVDTAKAARPASPATAEFHTHFATNRPEDVEVDEDGTRLHRADQQLAPCNDTHGSIRRLREDSNDPTRAAAFTWEDYAAGGPTGRADAGEQGFSSPDNLVFDKAGNLWVVTDISSSVAEQARRPYALPRATTRCSWSRARPQRRRRVPLREHAVEAEGTGPYFTPDEQTLFVNVQHPGEETGTRAAVFGNAQTYTSYWPKGNKTDGPEPVDADPVARRDHQAPATDAAGPAAR